MRLTLSVPPPSTNNIYHGRRYKTETYTSWATAAGWEVKAQRPTPVPGRLRVRLEVPFRLNRDVDNGAKALLDLAVNLGLIEDDSRVDELLIVRVAPDRPTVVEIEPMVGAGREPHRIGRRA